MTSYSAQDYIEIQSDINQVVQMEDEAARDKYLRKISKIVQNKTPDISLTSLSEETLDELKLFLSKIKIKKSQDFAIFDDYESKPEDKLNNQEKKFLKHKKMNKQKDTKELDVSRVSSERSKSSQGKKKKVKRPQIIQ